MLSLRPEGQGASVSCIRKSFVVILSSIQNQQAIFGGVTLSFTFCLQLNHATDVILPLFPCTLILGLDCYVSSSLRLWKHVETLWLLGQRLAAVSTRNLVSRDSPKLKHVLRHRESKKLSRAASTSYCPVHLFIWTLWSTLAEDETHLIPTGFLPISPFSRVLSTTLQKSGIGTPQSQFWMVVHTDVFLFLTGAWNSGWLSSLVTHPSLMPCSMCISSVFGTWPWDLLRPRFSNHWKNGSENHRQTSIRGVCRWVST